MSSSQDRFSSILSFSQPIRLRPASPFTRGFSVIHGEGARCTSSVWSGDFNLSSFSEVLGSADRLYVHVLDIRSRY